MFWEVIFREKTEFSYMDSMTPHFQPKERGNTHKKKDRGGKRVKGS